jgi:hypothetical protein
MMRWVLPSAVLGYFLLAWGAVGLLNIPFFEPAVDNGGRTQRVPRELTEP